jgi:tetratricopeptide (TPR) repeat protein
MITSQRSSMESPYGFDTSYKRSITSDGASDSAFGNHGNLVLGRVLEELKSAQHEFGGDDNAVADAWNALGLVRVHMQRDTKGAIACHEEALRIFIKNGQRLEEAFTLNDLAYCYEQLGEPSTAIHFYEDALRIFVEEKLSEHHPKVLSTYRALCRMGRR